MTTSYPPEVLDPPSPSALELTLADEIAELKAQRRDERFAESIKGRGPWWEEPGNEEEYAMWKVLRAAMALPGATPAQRWGLAEAAIRELAWADACAEELP